MTKKDLVKLAVACITIIIITRAILYLGFVPSASMENTIKENSIIIGIRVAQEYEKGDLVIFKEDDKYMIKRVIATGGDTVKLKDNTLYINGQAQDEPYLKETPVYNIFETTVPAGEYFVMGDNRNNSHDSRYIGTIEEEDIVAKCVIY